MERLNGLADATMTLTLAKAYIILREVGLVIK